MAQSQDTPMVARGRPNLTNDYELQCGHVDKGGDVCHGPCGAMQLGPVAVIVDASESPDAAPPREQSQVYLYAPNGYVRDDEGVWDQSTHARANARYGRRPTYRRPLASPGDGRLYAWRPVEEYPYVVRCPWCGEKRTLRSCDEARLVVDK